MTLTVARGELALPLLGAHEAADLGVAEQVEPVAVEWLVTSPTRQSITLDVANGGVELLSHPDFLSGRRFIPALGIEAEDYGENLYRVNEGDPLSATVRCRRRSGLRRPGWDVRVEADAVMRASAEEFIVETELRAFEDGRIIALRTFETRVPGAASERRPSDPVARDADARVVRGHAHVALVGVERVREQERLAVEVIVATASTRVRHSPRASVSVRSQRISAESGSPSTIDHASRSRLEYSRPSASRRRGRRRRCPARARRAPSAHRALSARACETTPRAAAGSGPSSGCAKCAGTSGSSRGARTGSVSALSPPAITVSATGSGDGQTAGQNAEATDTRSAMAAPGSRSRRC